MALARYAKDSLLLADCSGTPVPNCDQNSDTLFGVIGWYTLTNAGLVGISTLLLNYVYDGWYAYYVFLLPTQHPLKPEMLTEFWTDDIIDKLPIAVLLTLVFLFNRFRQGDKRTFVFYLLNAAGMLGGSPLCQYK